uniref:Uncharacterized protein n=1 Tax=Rhizophora mucronata TaxID=61149 RepID=A0A2P2Q1P9_RHIMU
MPRRVSVYCFLGDLVY